MRIRAKEEHNDALDQATKGLMVTPYGKTGQIIHDNKLLISGNNDEIEEIYQTCQVSADVTLENEEQ
jgi:hypothetical protein